MVKERRLIDVNDGYAKAILEMYPYYPDEIWKFISMTKRFPVVDAREIVHGRWEPRPYRKLDSNGRLIAYCDFHYCSECGEDKPIVPPYNYCPNCGADMRGNNNEA